MTNPEHRIIVPAELRRQSPIPAPISAHRVIPDSGDSVVEEQLRGDEIREVEVAV